MFNIGNWNYMGKISQESTNQVILEEKFYLKLRIHMYCLYKSYEAQLITENEKISYLWNFLLMKR